MYFSTSAFSILRLSVASIALSSILMATPFEDGIKAFDNKDYASAIKIWQPLADKGNTAAQYNLGILYENGYGVHRDDTEALKWYQKAAEQGHIDSQYNLGVMYGAGVGTQKNEILAKKWLSKAAEQGDSEAKKILETRYSHDSVPVESTVPQIIQKPFVAETTPYKKHKKRKKIKG